MFTLAGIPSPHTLSALGEDVLAGTQRSLRTLELLHAIEATIDALCYDQTRFGAIAAFTRKVEETLRTCPRDKPLDPDGHVEAVLLSGQEATKKYYDRLISAREIARREPIINDEDGLVDAFTVTIAVVAELHNAVNDVRWALGEYDADLSPRARDCTATTPEELAQHLDAL